MKSVLPSFFFLLCRFYDFYGFDSVRQDRPRVFNELNRVSVSFGLGYIRLGCIRLG